MAGQARVRRPRLDLCACIFEENGTPIDEPGDFVTAGMQPLEDEDEAKTFSHDWAASFYRYNRETVSSQPPQNKDEADDLSEDDSSKQGSEPDSEQLPNIAAVGKRIKLCMGIPAKWYSGKVFEDHLKSNSVLIAFDDGDLHRFDYKFLAAELAIKALTAAVDSEQGVVANTTGYTAVVDTLIYAKIMAKGCSRPAQKGGSRLASC